MIKRELNQKEKKTLAFILLCIFLAIFIALVLFIGIPMLRFISDPLRFRAWVEEKGAWSKLAFIFMKMLKVIICIIPGEPLELAAGYAFGTWMGMLLCTIGTTLGSIITFTLVRVFGLSVARTFFSQEKLDSLKFLKSSKKRDMILFILNVIPGTPKDILNYFAGLTDINFYLWVFLCSIGRIPSVFTSTICGNAFGQKRYALAIIVLIATFAFGALGLCVYNKVVDKGNKNLKTE